MVSWLDDRVTVGMKGRYIYVAVTVDTSNRPVGDLV